MKETTPQSRKEETTTGGEREEQLDHFGGADGIGTADKSDEEYVARHAGPEGSTDKGIASAGPVGDPNNPRDVGTGADAGRSGGVGQTGKKCGAAHKA